jgi:chromosome segregation ATPase
MIQERLTRMKQEIAELREAGKKEEAQEKEQQLAATMRHLSQDRPKQDGVSGPERMQHLEQAIRHVEAAGLADVSRDLQKVAAHFREEMERQEHEARERRGGSGEGERGETQALRRELERNRDEMQRMQREIRELRAKLGVQSPAPDRHD